MITERAMRRRPFGVDILIETATFGGCQSPVASCGSLSSAFLSLMRLACIGADDRDPQFTQAQRDHGLVGPVWIPCAVDGRMLLR